MRRINRKIVITLSIFALLVPLLAGSAVAGNIEPRGSYVVVASEETTAQGDWQKVIEQLRNKYDASLVVYRGGVNDVIPVLSEYMPGFTCFVEPADSADLDFVVAVQRLTRQLDSDPYTDTQWAILTGFVPEDALRIVSCSDELVVDKIFSGTVSIGLDNVAEGYQFDEGKPAAAVQKLADGSTVKLNCPADSTRAIAAAMQDNVDAIYTSGHGSPTGWQIGYNYRDGFIRGADGQVYGYDATGKTFNFTTSNTKVYLPCGNCLIGNIPQRDCFATAMMHSAGVNQMFGYIVVTFYGYMGWGTNTYFGQLGGKYTLSEAFYANQQALLYTLGERFPALQRAEFTNYDYQTIGQLADANGYSENNDAVGMLWDRDALAFYGDPAWRASVMKTDCGWDYAISHSSETDWTLEITASRDGSWPDRPLVFMLPQRIENVSLTEGIEYKPVITDNFVLLPLTGKYQAGESIKLAFSADTAAAKRTGKALEPQFVGVSIAQKYKEALTAAPAEYRPLVKAALAAAGDNAPEIAKVLTGVEAGHREAAAFLIAYMPKSDLKTLGSELLIDNIELTYQAAESKQWEGIEHSIFLNNVLPYANLDEVRVNWRSRLMETFMPLVKDCKTPSEAAQKLNKELWTLVNVKYSTEREKPNQNPFESMESGLASCSGLSILLVDACRSVGIPARVAGIARWPHKEGNHSWVEVWDGKWYTLGAWDGEGLDDVWFAGDAARAREGSPYYGIYAVSYEKTDNNFICAWDPENTEIAAVEVTDRYLDMWQPDRDGYLTAVRVYDSNNKRIAAQIKVCSPGECFPLATSRDESRDTNDTATFALTPGNPYKIEVSYEGQTKTIEFKPEDKPFQTVEIRI